MRVMKWSMIALAVTAGTSQLAVAASAQEESKGFVEDSTLSLLARAMYYNRDARNGAGFNRVNGPNGEFIKFKHGHAEESGLSARVLFESGFTQGTIGFGLNAYAGALHQIDTGDGRRGVNMLPENGGNSTSIANAAVKARFSNTTLTYGNQMPSLPVLAFDDGRLLPETFQGTMITSKEVEGLVLNAGHFTAQNVMRQGARDAQRLKGIDVAGGSYAFNDQLTAAAYYSDLEDTFKKKYANVNFVLPITDGQSLTTDFNIYRTDYDRDYTTADQNTIWSLSTKYAVGPHGFTLAYQRSTGDAGFDYGNGDGGGAIFLANSFLSDFNQEDERSWRVSYDLDLSTFGVPGLSMMTAYVWADNITVRNIDDRSIIDNTNGKEHEWYNQVKYVVQEGPAKNLSFKLRSSLLRGTTGNSTNDTNEVRAYIEYPLSIL